MTTSIVAGSTQNDTDAHFQAWVQEVYTALVTTCGLTQTADTGQMAVPCATAHPAAVGSVGYYIFAFNDTLQGTAPIYVKLEFGAGYGTGTATDPQMWITVGTSTDGAGTIGGVVTTRVPCGSGNYTGSATNYSSYYCYNAAQGYLGLVHRHGYHPYAGLFGFALFRTVNSAGSPTQDGVCLVTNYNTNANIGSSSSYGYSQILDFNAGAAVTLPAQTAWAWIPYTVTTTVQGTESQVFPVVQFNTDGGTTPGWGITNALALALFAEIALASTCSFIILGSLSLTYINLGSGPGAGVNEPPAAQGTYTTVGCLMLWE